MESKPFVDFQILLEKSYPAIHNNLKKEVINQYSLLYKWPGKNPKLEPKMTGRSNLSVVKLLMALYGAEEPLT